MASGPPKFKPFTKTKVILSLEPTPTPAQLATDLLAVAPAKFPRAENAAGEGGAEEAPAVPQMFAKKKREREPQAPRPRGPGAKARVSTLFPGLIAKARTILGAPGADGGPGGHVYARMNVISRDAQAAEIAKFPETIQKMAKELVDVEVKIPYQVEPAPPVFIPTSRRGFGSFLIDQYGPIFPTGSQRALDVATCAAKGDAGKKEVKIYHYQAFVREYLRYETPYRGLLVYHGLGSGKTCSAIAAAEALFGTRGMKIVVMTPFSLRDNFISEITFCGFKHFRLQNHWVPIDLKAGGANVPDAAFLRMFAKSVYGIPDSFFKKGRGKEVTRFWIPDFTKEEEPNFDSLSPQERSEIQGQIRAIIETRIKFINYNGITARELKTMVCSTPDIFDNAVIVVDEIHNLTRLIQGSLENYFTNPSGRRRVVPLERLTPEREKLPLCGMTKNYLRGYLFYRLFMDAKNSKIIGLSGTPLINFPEELGIMMNILHGPLQQIKFEITAEAMRDTQAIVTKSVERNPDLDSVFFKASEGVYVVTVMRLPEQFTRVFSDDNELLGIKRRDPGAATPTLTEIWTALETDLKAEKITVKGKPVLSAQELLPSWDTPFRAAFLEEDGITLKNELVLKKRMRGLISYYRGIQGSVMPRVKKDETVGVPLTGYSLKMYNKLRNQEIQQEMQKPKEGAAGGGKDDIWAEANEIATMKSPSNYRMSSRQACNFVFPESITRPRPRDLGEFDVETGRDRDQVVDADVEDTAAGHEIQENEEIAEAEDAAVRAEMAAPAGAEAAAAGEAAKVGFGVGAKERQRAYLAAIKASKDRLRAIGETHLKLDGPPEHNLAKYSPKFAAILTNMNKLAGSSLIYSQFLEMEGIGIFGICLEANGWQPIEILETAEGMKFSDRTIASLAKGPGVKENRYIEFTGVGSKEQRGAAVNVFNARIDKLSPAMAKVLTDAGWENNFDGGLCRAFMITSAGAEGLSLKCVRGVHIMEPYWNTVRTEQVKGRAVRICSHMDLPEDQQDVEIYTYCTMIPDEAVAAQAVDRTLEQSDSYNAKAAADLGVPIPGISEGPIPEGLFLPVAGAMGGEGEAKNEAEVAAPGAQATMLGAVRFYSKLANEYRGFSNFAPTPFVLNEKRYPTVEHYFQSMKFPDNAMYAEAIRVAPTPAKAKFLGQSKEHKIRADWDKVKESIMLDALRAKFQQNKPMLELLKATGTRPIIEASPDPYWGEGRTGKGKNRLGKLIEQIREELREYAPNDAGGAAAVAPLAAEGEGAIDEAFFGGENAIEEEGGAAAAAGGEGEEAEEEGAIAEGVGSGQAGDAEAAAGGEKLLKGGGKEDERVILLTSDQRVLLISLRKKVVLSALTAAMKSVAVDCELNFADNNDGSFRCLDLGESVGDFAYHPDLAEDIKETEARFRKVKPAAAATGKAAGAGAFAPPVAEVALAAVAEAAAEEAAPKAASEALPGEEGAAAAATAQPPPAAEVAPPPAVKKPKRLLYKGTEYYYQIKVGGAGKPEGYMLFATTDPELNTPVGFIKANEKGLPSGPVLPPPA
jgi:ribA/ribD-fused uncharacterized protein